MVRMRSLVLPLLSLLVAGLVAPAVQARVCDSDTDCGEQERCHGLDECGEGVCAPAFTLPRFPLDPLGLTAYSVEITAVLDHSGSFYTQCCDTEITATTGETVVRGPNALCPVEPVFPACFLQTCVCSYPRPDGEPFVINGNYVGFGGTYLLYDGHAGYDYSYPRGTSIVAPRAGRLCKAFDDPINGHVGVPTAWDKFHTFYVDHGPFGDFGYASWYLHAHDLSGLGLAGRELRDLAPGECAGVAEGQVVALVGNFGTFVPHLHFELRRYPLGEDPESAFAQAIDPYGWTGAGTDPIAENPQAAVQEGPAWLGCGNGRRECGEGCDDGNSADGDGCSADCELDPLLQCLEDLDALRAQLDQCLAETRPADADGDGEADASDRCPGTPAGAAVDDAGCSRRQFCGAQRLRSVRDLLRCVTRDWRNDEPLLRVPKDCRPDRRWRRCTAR